MIRFDTQKLERQRVLRGLKKSKLARIVNVGPSTITAVFNGNNRSAQTVKSICDALGISIEEVMIEEGKPAA